MQETLYKAIFDHIKNPVVVADTNGIIDMNSAFLSLFNFSEKVQVLSNSYYTNIVQEVIQSGSPSWREISDSTGRLLEVEVCPSPLQPENRTFLLEFNQFHDEALYEEMSIESGYGRELFNSLPDAIVVLDNHGNIIDINQSFEAVFGYSRFEVIGRDIDKLVVPEESFEAARELFKRVVNQERVEAHVKRVTKSGELLDFLAIGYPVIIDRKIAGNYVIYKDISREKETERKLQEKEEFLEQIFNRSLYPIAILDDNELVLDVNLEFEKLFGYGKDQLLGKSIVDFIVPSDLKEESEYFRKQVFEKEAMAAKTKRKNSRGELIDVEAVGSPVIIHNQAVGMFAMYRDTRVEDKALFDLKVEKAYFKQLFENTPNPVAIVDKDGKIVDVNTPFESIFEYQRGKVAGHGLISLLVPKERRDEAEIYARGVLFEGKSFQYETVRKSSSGKNLEVEVIAFPINIDRDQIGSYVIFQDISERKHKEREIYSLLYSDPLTGLFNRKYAYERLAERFQRAGSNNEKGEESIAIIYIDLDKFKEINDHMGHRMGDAVLLGFAERMKDRFKGSLELCRIGGDEFLGILPRSTGIGGYTEAVARLFEEPLIIGTTSVEVKVSAGYAVHPKDGESIDELVSSADARMYHEKRRKRILENPVRRQISLNEIEPLAGDGTSSGASTSASSGGIFPSVEEKGVGNEGG